MSVDAFLVLHRWFHRAYTLRDPSALELVAPDVVCEGLSPEPVRGREAWRASYQRILEVFPELHFEFQDVVVDGERVAAHARARGRHRNGAAVDFMGGGQWRIVDGQFVSSWDSWDFLTGFTQTGHLAPGLMGACLAEAGAPAPEPGPEPLPRHDCPGETVRLWFREAYERRNARVATELLCQDMFAEGLGTRLEGREDFVQQFYLPLVRAFTDFRFTLRDVVVGAGRAAVRAEVECTHAATGNRARFQGGGFVHVREGQLSAGFNHWDFVSLLRATGHLEHDPFRAAGLA